MPNEPFTYLSVFQDALHEIEVMNTDTEVRAVLDAGGATATDAQVAECAHSLLVADWRQPATWADPVTVRALIDEMLAREPAAQRVWFERLLTVLSKSTSEINQTDIKAAAEALGLPAELQIRIVARLLAAGFLSNSDGVFKVYEPIRNLLR